MIGAMSTPGRHPPRTTYEIVVRGRLSESVESEIGALRIEPQPIRTLIVIEIIDQAHLRGVLEHLGDRNIDIESVVRAQAGAIPLRDGKEQSSVERTKGNQ